MDSRSTVLVSLLEAGACDYLLRKDGSQERIGVLQGKIVGLLFSANGSRLCQSFIQKLIPMYREFSAKGQFEILFISDDKSEAEFMASLGAMPWLAVPFSNRQTESLLSNNFQIARIPAFVVIGADGKQILTRHGEKLVIQYGAKAFPFTQDHIAALEKKQNEKALTLPTALQHPSHAHPLVLTDDPYNNQGAYGCDLCGNEGYGWSYHCARCSFDLHPTCVNSRYDLSAPAPVPTASIPATPVPAAVPPTPIPAAPVPKAPISKAPVEVPIAEAVKQDTEKVKTKAPTIAEQAAIKAGEKVKAKAPTIGEQAARKDGEKVKIKAPTIGIGDEVARKAGEKVKTTISMGEEVARKDREKVKTKAPTKGEVVAEEAVGKTQNIKDEVIAVAGKVAEKIKGEAGALGEKVAGQTEKLKGEVASQTQKLKGEVAVQTEKLKGELASKTEKLKGELAVQTEKLKGEVAVQTEKLKGELTGKAEKLKGEVARKTDQLKGEAAAKAGKLKDEVAAKKEKIAGKTEELKDHIMAKKNEWLLLLLTVIFIILALLHLFWRILPPSLKRKVKHLP